MDLSKKAKIEINCDISSIDIFRTNYNYRNKQDGKQEALEHDEIVNTFLKDKSKE